MDGFGFVIFGVGLFLAYANGANDNFMGVATLFGSHTTDYRQALRWATITTFAGSICSYFLARGLVETFSGKGFVPNAVVGNPVFMVSVILGAAAAVFLASQVGIPISTTHSLTGALVGAGLVAMEGQVHFEALGKNFVLPLLLSPILGFALTLGVYPSFRRWRKALNVTKTTCVCVGNEVYPINPALVRSGSVVLSQKQLKGLNIVIDEKEACEAKVVHAYKGRCFGLEAQSVLDALHFLSAGMVSFARGLNDTPKMVALCVTSGLIGLDMSTFALALSMALGGLWGARKVAQTMSYKITEMNHGQGFSANLVTSFIVVLASGLGMPVSTTHVSCGSIFGIGAINDTARLKTISGIASAWVLTLPCAASLSAIMYFVFS